MANSKLEQLSLAQEIGLEIPSTIISNDPEAVRHFVREHMDCVVKPLSPMNWQKDDKVFSIGTTGISLEDLENDRSIQLCPMIYQKKIQKKVEYRITIFGQSVVCIEIDSQKIQRTATDWRAAPNKLLPMRQSHCNPRLLELLLEFMRRSNVLFGTFDIAETPDGRFVFFEINPQGQFLWIEQRLPHVALLDHLARFLAEPSRDFGYASNPDTALYLSAFERDDAAVAEIKHAANLHRPYTYFPPQLEI